eukprot:Skav219668  [mRNA]  locus=scaffold1257:398030:401696:+ [translate_table: standard]
MKDLTQRWSRSRVEKSGAFQPLVKCLAGESVGCWLKQTGCCIGRFPERKKQVPKDGQANQEGGHHRKVRNPLRSITEDGAVSLVLPGEREARGRRHLEVQGQDLRKDEQPWWDAMEVDIG